MSGVTAAWICTGPARVTRRRRPRGAAVAIVTWPPSRSRGCRARDHRRRAARGSTPAAANATMPAVVAPPVSVTGRPAGARAPSAPRDAAARCRVGHRAPAARSVAVSVSVGSRHAGQPIRHAPAASGGTASPTGAAVMTSSSRRRTVIPMPSPLSRRLRRALPRIRWTRRRVVTWSSWRRSCSRRSCWAVLPAPAAYRTQARMLTVPTGPNGTSRSTWTPRSTCRGRPAPRIRCRRSCWRTASAAPRRCATHAEDFAEPGLRGADLDGPGFGRSGGQIHLDSPDYEVRDAPAARLARRPARGRRRRGRRPAGRRGRRLVRRRAWRCCSPAQDQRVDAIVPMITWNDLANGVPAAVDRRRTDRGRVQEGVGRPVLRQRRRPTAGGGSPATAATATAADPARRPAVTRRAAGSPRTSARRTCDRHHRRRRPGDDRAAATVQPGRRCSTGSRRRRC